MRFFWVDDEREALKAVWEKKDIKPEDINLREMKAELREKRREEDVLYDKHKKAIENNNGDLEIETFLEYDTLQMVNDAVQVAINQVSKEKAVNHAKKALNDPKYLLARRKMAKEKVVKYVKKAIYDPERLITRKIMKRKLENPEPPKIKPAIIRKKRKEK